MTENQTPQPDPVTHPILPQPAPPGFPPELARSAFERFTRGDAARTRVSGGAGLGLSIVAAIVRAHGGDVRLISKPGDTRVTVRIPGMRAT